MKTAQDIMNSEPPHCDIDTPVSKLAALFAEKGTTGILVVDEEQRLMGVVTETNLLDRQANLHVPTAIALFDMVIPLGEAKFEQELARLQALTVGDLLSGAVHSVAPDSSLAEVAEMMTAEKLDHLPVIGGETVVGMITKHDVITALVSS
ncbi:MAG: CBS domain-containing protein [Mariprofundaceae bacterium]